MNNHFIVTSCLPHWYIHIFWNNVFSCKESLLDLAEIHRMHFMQMMVTTPWMKWIVPISTILDLHRLVDELWLSFHVFSYLLLQYCELDSHMLMSDTFKSIFFRLKSYSHGMENASTITFILVQIYYHVYGYLIMRQRLSIWKKSALQAALRARAIAMTNIQKLYNPKRVFSIPVAHAEYVFMPTNGFKVPFQMDYLWGWWVWFHDKGFLHCHN